MSLDVFDQPRYLKNLSTSSALFHINTSTYLPANSVPVEVDSSILYRYNDSQMRAWFNSGEVLFNDGTTDITNKYEGFHKLNAFCYGIPFLSNTNSTRNNGFLSENAQEAIEESRTSFVGKGFQTTFLGNGTVKNKWLENEDSDIQSNYTPDVFKYHSKLVGIDFTNQNSGMDQTMLIAISNYGNGTTIDRSYKWTLTNSRCAVKVNQVNGFTVNPGDKMAVYSYDTGTDAQDIVISMDFIVTIMTNQDIKEDFSTNFRFNDFPAISSIPEIFS